MKRSDLIFREIFLWKAKYRLCNICAEKNSSTILAEKKKERFVH